MDKITQSLTLDLVDIQHNVVNAIYGDRITRDLDITITNNGYAYNIPSGAKVRLRGHRPDGKYIFYDGEITDGKNGGIHMDIPPFLLSCGGRAKLDIGIYQNTNDGDTEIASTESFILYIPDNIFSEEEVVNSDNGSVLSKLINTAEKEIEEMNELETRVSSNEEERISNELDRQSEEQKRIENEDVRKENEETRKENEETRKQQESKRQNDTDNAINNANDATNSANSAAENANNAATNANNKANDLQNKLDSHYFALTEDLQSHNSSTSAHDDIRQRLSSLLTRLNALADSDDTTLDQLSEIVAYIKANRSLIDSITTSKVNVTDIIDNLTSTATNKPLSAKQGKVLNDLITALTATIPTKTSQLTNDSGFKTTDTTYTHPTTSGNKHIPSGGSSGQFLKWSSDGTAVWASDNNTWRGIQNNLNSDSDTDSLSAKQGKVLNTSKLDKSGGTMTGELKAHGGISLDGSTTQSNLQFLIGIDAFLEGGKMHWQTASNVSVGSADKLSTARTIFGKSFDGSSNVAGKGTFYGTATDTASSRFTNSALEIRENGLNGNSSSDVKYAPTIGFHWANTIAASLRMNASGAFNFLKQNGTDAAPVWALFISKNQLGIEDTEGRINYPIHSYGDGAGNGSQLVFGGAGNVFFGSGESPSNLYTAFQTSSNIGQCEVYTKSGENCYLISDNYMYFYVGANTVGNRKGFRFNPNNSSLEPVKNTELKIGNENNHVSQIHTDYEYADNIFAKEGIQASFFSGKSNNSQYWCEGIQFTDCVGAIIPGYSKSGNDGDNKGFTYHSGKLTLGTSTYKFGTLYSSSSTINGSDRNIKENIAAMHSNDPEKYLELFDAINIFSFTYRDLEKREDSFNPVLWQKHQRKHIGLISQDAEDTIKSIGLTSNDIGLVCKEFFCPPEKLNGAIFGGYQIPMINDEGKELSYSENTYNYKHSFDEEYPTEFEWKNEILDKAIEDIEMDDWRTSIQYLMIEDNSKLTENQPPVIINSITLVDQDDNYIDVPLDLGCIYNYAEDDEEYSTPRSHSEIQEDGSLKIDFDLMYSTVFVKLFDEPVDIRQYKTILFDVDYVSEYKMVLLPPPDKDYVTANIKDLERQDQSLYNYNARYQELHNLTSFALQETRKELRETKTAFEDYKKETDRKIQQLEATLECLVKKEV